MKKLLMTMAASVAAIGLTYADEEINDGGQGEATVQPTLVELLNDFGEDGFEQNEGDVFDTDAAPWGNVIWTTSEAESIVVDKVDDNYRLKLETAKDAPLLRTFADYGTPPEGEEAVDNRTITPIENQDVIVDAKITFTGFEEAPVPTEGEDKILVWMKAVDTEFDDINGTGATNLMITAGQLAEDGIKGPLQYEIALSEPAVVGKEYQVTIKSVGNIVDTEAIVGGVLGFEVYIDGKQVKFSAEDSDFWAEYTASDKRDNVFPALVTGTTLKAAGFEGTGTIDDVLVCAADNEEMAPVFTQGQGGDDVEIDPIAPGGEIDLGDEDAATELAQTIKDAADKSKYITVPDGITASKDSYLGMFEAVASGTKVSIQLTVDATNALQEVVNNLTTNAVAALLSTLASAGVDAVDPVLNITGGQPGFWYSIKAGAELDGMVEGDRAMADDTGAVTLTVPVIKVNEEKSKKAFYKVLINLNNLKDKDKVPSVE